MYTYSTHSSFWVLGFVKVYYFIGFFVLFFFAFVIRPTPWPHRLFCIIIRTTVLYKDFQPWEKAQQYKVNISLVRCAHSWAIKINSRREILYLRAPCIILSIYLLSITNASKRTVSIVSHRDLYFNHVHRRRLLISRQKFKQFPNEY